MRAVRPWEFFGVGEIGTRLLDIGWDANDQQAQVVCLAASFADSGEWALDGYSTAGRWIAHHLDIALRTANEWIRVGRALQELPQTTKALAEQAISFSKAKELTRSATAENEQDLLAIAEVVPASRLGVEIAAWLSGCEPDESIDARQRQARSLTWRTEPDGTVAFSGRLPPVDAGRVIAAVDAAVMAQAITVREVDEEWPSLAQQRADGLVEVVMGGGAGVQAEVVLHVRGDGATLDDGSPVTGSAVAGIVEEAFVRVLIHDAEGRPINASSRQRHPTARQKRVVKERDRVCVDCGSAVLLEYDHVPDFDESKRTVVDELELRCAPCHTFRHRQAG